MVHFWHLTHFCHRNVIEYSKRPFSSIEEHDEILISNWNKCVKKNDIIYFLGDFCLANKEKTLEIRKRLNGQIFFIIGNHDKSAHQIRDTFVSYDQTKIVSPNGQPIFLSHYAHVVWPRMWHGCISCFGHSHSGLKERTLKCTDVGVDATAKRLSSFELGNHKNLVTNQSFYRPLGFDELMDIMKDRKNEPHIGRIDKIKRFFEFRFGIFKPTKDKFGEE